MSNDIPRGAEAGGYHSRTRIEAGREREVCGVFPPGLRVGAGALGGAGPLRAVYHLLRGATCIDLTQFYLIALVSRVDPAASFYDPEVFPHYYQVPGIDHGTLPDYAPLAALPLRPFPLMSYAAASRRWLPINILLAAGVIAWAGRRAHRRKSRRPSPRACRSGACPPDGSGGHPGSSRSTV